jgi:hypothetical protein
MYKIGDYLNKYTIVLCMIFVTYLMKFFNNLSFIGIYGSSFFYPSSDNFYWFYFFSGIPYLISKSFLLSLFLDVLLLSIPIILIFYYNRILSILMTLNLINYFVYFNSYAFHHFHDLISLIFLSIWIIFYKSDLKNEIWDLIRYYFLFSFSSAGIWKLFREAIFSETHFAQIIKNQHAEEIIYNSDSFHASLSNFILKFPEIGHFIFIVATIIELLFLIGFFTKKMDHYLLLLFLIFCILNYFIMGIDSHIYGFFCIVLINRRLLRRFRFSF